MLCHGLEIKFVHFGLFKIFGKGNPFAYGLQEALWCVDDCGRSVLVEKYGRFYEHFVEHFFPTANSCIFESYLSVGKNAERKVEYIINDKR